MRTAFSYHRYSIDMQRDAFTLGAQRNITKEIARKHDVRIIQVYETKAKLRGIYDYIEAKSGSGVLAGQLTL